MEFLREHWRDGLEILILTILVYQAYIYFRATRAVRILTGLLLVLFLLTLLSSALKLDVIEWLMKSILAFLAVALVVIFQPELRRGLAEIGSSRLWFWAVLNPQPKDTADELIDIAESLAQRRYGALIAIEREISLKQYLDSGVDLDCKLSREIMECI
ncbi:MAG: TIGR00159 family protein, partial [Verrucomicrobiota bacterium]